MLATEERQQTAQVVAVWENATTDIGRNPMEIIGYRHVLSWSNGEGNVLHVAARRNATTFLQVLLSPNRDLAFFALDRKSVV